MKRESNEKKNVDRTNENFVNSMQSNTQLILDSHEQYWHQSENNKANDKRKSEKKSDFHKTYNNNTSNVLIERKTS